MGAMVVIYRLVNGSEEDARQSLSISDAWKKAKKMGLREAVLYSSDQTVEGDSEVVIQSRWWTPEDAKKFFDEYGDDIQRGENFELERVGPRRILQS